MTTPHSTLTGTDLHESKGAAAATAGQVPVANGSGNAIFGFLTASSLTGTGNSFGGQLLHVREEQNQNTVSSNATTTGSFIDTVLNVTKTNEIGATLGTNQITLLAGTYFIEASIPYASAASFVPLNYMQPRLYNYTTSTTLVWGQQSQVSVSSVLWAWGQVNIRGRFTLSGTSVVAIQHQKSNVSIKIGVPANMGTEVYTEALIWKIA